MEAAPAVAEHICDPQVDLPMIASGGKEPPLRRHVKASDHVWWNLRAGHSLSASMPSQHRYPKIFHSPSQAPR